MTTIHTTDKDVNVRPKKAASELYPTVKHEKRPNGDPVFPSEKALNVHLVAAFHKGLIAGHRSSARVFWINLEDALEYTVRYIELAKKKMKVFFPTRGTKFRKTNRLALPIEEKQKPKVKAAPVSNNGDSNGRCRYLVEDKDGGMFIVKDKSSREMFSTTEDAAIAALMQLKVTLYEVEHDGRLQAVEIPCL